MTLPPPVPRQRHIVSPRLERVAFKTSRLLDFVGRRELTAQIGHPPEQWPLVILKELVDNALDACEEAEVAPEITAQIKTATGAILVSDNGPGLRPETVIDILDYSVRVSSREAYVSPTRGGPRQRAEDDPRHAVRARRRPRRDGDPIRWASSPDRFCRRPHPAGTADRSGERAFSD